jgi:hypothetical protein
MGGKPMANISNTGSGAWEATQTWNTGTVPTASDNVILNFFDPNFPNNVYTVSVNQIDTANNVQVFGNGLLQNNILQLNVSPRGIDPNLIVVETFLLPTVAKSMVLASWTRNRFISLGPLSLPLIQTPP